MSMFNFIVRLLGLDTKTKSNKFSTVYSLNYCKYNGFWCGIYSSNNPVKDNAFSEFCSYQYKTPSEIWNIAREKCPDLKSIQIKYFISGVDDNDNIRTVIFECNKTENKLWWTYCKNKRPLSLIRKIVNEEIKSIKKVRVMPTMKNGKIVYWLVGTGGWNRHCKYLMGYDEYKIQEFVVRYV